MNTPRFPRRLDLVFVLGGAFAMLGCGGRPQGWAESLVGTQSFGLTNAVVLVDPPAHRAVGLGIDAMGALVGTRFPLGHALVPGAIVDRGDKLYLMSAGYRATLGDTRPDEAPRLTIIDGATTPATSRDISLDVLSDPLDGLAIDPTGRWAVVYAAGGAGAAFVTNPNELVIVDLATANAKPPQAVVLHSFGGHPEKLIFAPALGLPAGTGHLLVVQSDQDFTLLSLDDPTKPDITVRLADATAVTRPHPAEVVFDDGDPAKSDDARFGIRFDEQSTVMTLQLEPATGPNGFAPTINVADVGGVPSAIAFVRTDGGLRLAALVPARASAVLVDPATTTSSEVALPAGYRNLSLVTGSTSGAAGPDVALLWNGSSAAPGVAFWELGRAAGLPFRSIETVGIAGDVTDVREVPGTKNQALKVLSTSGDVAGGAAFFILDLAARTATPLLTATSNVVLSVSPTGDRVWAFERGGVRLAATDLPSGRVHSLTVDSATIDLHEIVRADGGHALVVLHGNDGAGATVFDADDPKEANRRIYGGLLTEGPYDDQ